MIHARSTPRHHAPAVPTLRTASVLFPGAAQHVALAEWCAADPGSFRARSVAYPGFREDMMWNDPGSAEHRSARAPRCTAFGKSMMASTRPKHEKSNAIALRRPGGEDDAAGGKTANMFWLSRSIQVRVSLPA